MGSGVAPSLNWGMHWTPAPPPQPLGETSVHIWRFHLDTDADPVDLRKNLVQSELARADRYSSANAARNFTVARAALRRVLGAYLGVLPAHVPITTGPYGKGILEPDGYKDTLEFNLAHSGNLGLVAVARKVAVGVDIERHDSTRDLVDLAKSSFSDRELTRWVSLPEADRTEAFFDTWVRKEAFVKASGRGLGFGLRRFDVSIGPGPVRIEAVDGDPDEARCWNLHALEPGAGYSAAVAARAPMIQPEMFQAGAWEGR